MINSNALVLSLDKDLDEYTNLLSKIKNKSIYFAPSYLLSAQKAEGYPIKVIVVHDNESFALIPYVWRKINDLPFCKDISEEMYDIITPHEYSGIITNAEHPEKKEKLFSALFSVVDNLCRAKRVIAEFARFDPFITGVSLMARHYNMRYVGENVYIDLERTEKEIWEDFEYSAQKNVRTAMRCGLQFYDAENGEEIDIFIHLYRSSMERLRASRYYYFNREYFFSLLKTCEGAKLFIIRNPDGSPVAASILLYYGDIAHHHLTGYDPAAIQKRPNDFMIYHLAMWAKKKGMKYLHLGGGAESIRKFKKKFSPLRIPYYVGYKIHNMEYYERLCEAWRLYNDNYSETNYFPLYRLNQ